MSETVSLPQPIEISPSAEAVKPGVRQWLGETALKVSDLIYAGWQEDLGPRIVTAMDNAYDTSIQAGMFMDDAAEATANVVNPLIDTGIELTGKAVMATAHGIKEGAIGLKDGAIRAGKAAGEVISDGWDRTSEVISRLGDEGHVATTGLGNRLREIRHKAELTRYFYREDTLRGSDGTAPGTFSGEGHNLFDRKVRHGLIEKDKVIKRSAADALHGANKPYQKEKEARGDHKPPVRAFVERRVHNSRARQQAKLNKKRARMYELEQIHGPTVGITTRQKRERGIPLEDLDFWDRRASRGFITYGGKEYRRLQRDTTRGGHFNHKMGYDRLARAAEGDTVFGRRRSRRIENLEQKQARDRERLGIRTQPRT